MEKAKLRPIDMVAREMEPHSDLPGAAEISRSIMGVYEHLEERASHALATDPNSEDALRKCQEFCVIAELVNFFGSQLIAYEDIERANMAGRPPAN